MVKLSKKCRIQRFVTFLGQFLAFLLNPKRNKNTVLMLQNIILNL